MQTRHLPEASCSALHLLLSVCLLTLPAGAWAAAGKILFANGNVKIINAAGQERPAKRGEALEAGDTIVTAAGSTLQARMEDGGVIAVRPDTQLKIDAFAYKNKDPKQDKALFSLSKGAFRSITGAIAEKNKDAYQINTPSASIGIRGTDHEPLVIPAALAGQVPAGTPGTYDKVNSGMTIMHTPAGSVEIRPNQVGFAAGRNEAPSLLPQIPSFYRATTMPSAPASNRTASASSNSAGTASTSGSTSGSDGTATSDTSSTTTATTDTASSSSTTSTTSTTGTTTSTTTVSDPLSSSTLLTTTTSTTTTSTTSTTNTTGSTSTLLGGTTAPIGAGGAGADTWVGPFGTDSGSGTIVVDGSAGKSVLLGPNGEMIFVSDSTSTTGGFQFSANTAPLQESGAIYDPNTGIKVSWGRWGPGYTVIDQGSAKQSLGSFHYIYSAALTSGSSMSALAQGNYTGNYSYAGGTSPTDQNGIAGTINSASMSVNFGTQQITSYAVNLSIAGNTWNASGSGALTAFVGGNTTGPSGIPLSGTCSGAGCSASSIDSTMSRAQGLFVGPKAEGVLSTFNLKAGSGSTATGAMFMK